MDLTEKQHEELLQVMTAKAQEVLGNAQDAHDVAMDAYIELLEGDVEHPFTVGPTRARSRALNHLRDTQRRKEIERESGETINAGLSAGWSGDNPAEIAEGREALEAINDLTPALRKSLWAVVVEGRSYKELADEEGVTEGAIRERVSAAKKQIGAA